MQCAECVWLGDERHLEMHAIGPAREMTAPVEAAPVGDLDQFPHASLLSNQRGPFAQLVPAVVDVESAPESMIAQGTPAAADEPRNECAVVAQDAIKQLGLFP